jgi:hypothetical protein
MLGGGGPVDLAQPVFLVIFPDAEKLLVVAALSGCL